MGAQDTVLYATIFIFVSINGLRLLKEVAAPGVRRESAKKVEEKNDSSEVVGFLGVVGLMLLVWGVLVSAGLSRLSQVFLT